MCMLTVRHAVLRICYVYANHLLNYMLCVGVQRKGWGWPWARPGCATPLPCLPRICYGYAKAVPFLVPYSWRRHAPAKHGIVPTVRDVCYGPATDLLAKRDGSAGYGYGYNKGVRRLCGGRAIIARRVTNGRMP